MSDNTITHFDNYREVPISDISIGKRIREEMGDVEALAKSIDKIGLINPITLKPIHGSKQEKFILVTGARRLEAVRSKLRWTSIPAHVIDFNYLLEPDFSRHCEVCDYPITDSHHIFPRWLGGVDKSENLMNLCPNHHRALDYLFKYYYITTAKKLKNNSDAREYLAKSKMHNSLIAADPKVIKFFKEIVEPKLLKVLPTELEMIHSVMQKGSRKKN